MISFIAATLASLSTEDGDGPTDARAIEDALEELFPDVRRWLHRFLGRRDDLDDATQDALLEIARSLPRFEGRSSIRTWAFPIVNRVAYRYVRQRIRARREGSAELVSLPDVEASPEVRAMHRESVRRFRACLDRLRPKGRMAFVLCAVEGVPHEEAAALQGVSIETLRARLKRARVELATMLRHDPVLAPLVQGAES